MSNEPGSFRQSAGILTPYEAEEFVKALRPFGISDVGSERWMKQHEQLEQLNIQAHHSALTKHDEFVVEYLISYEKVPVLIQNLVIIETWKSHLFPLIKARINEQCAIKAYIMLYHEAMLVNLLDIVLYNESAVESLFSSDIGVDHFALGNRDNIPSDARPLAPNESLLELIDYCFRKVNMMNLGRFNTFIDESNQVDLLKETAEQSLTRQECELGFRTAVSAFNSLRFISDSLSRLPLPAQTRLLNTHDMLMALVTLMETQFWIRRNDKLGAFQKFEDSNWRTVSADERVSLSKTDAQLWLLICNLCLDASAQTKYHMHSYRKNQLMRLKRYLNEVLVDQLPPLRQLQLYMEQLVLYEPPPPSDTPMLMIEQVPELRDRLIENTQWAAAAEQCLRDVLSDTDPERRRRELASLARTYNLDQYDEVLDDPVCAACGKIAAQRCSRCRHAWYCSRQCQVKAWTAHKPICEVLMNARANEAPQPTPAVNKAEPMIAEVKGKVEPVQAKPSAASDVKPVSTPAIQERVSRFLAEDEPKPTAKIETKSNERRSMIIEEID